MIRLRRVNVEINIEDRSQPQYYVVDCGNAGINLEDCTEEEIRYRDDVRPDQT